MLSAGNFFLRKFTHPCKADSPALIQFPTFDISPHRNHLLRHYRTLYAHKDRICGLQYTMHRQANKVLTLDPTTLPPGSKELLSTYEAKVRKLKVKAEMWVEELGELRKEICNWLFNT